MSKRKPTPGLSPPDTESAWRTVVPSSPRSFVCETITPLYGGGVVAGKVDLEMPIRPSGLRGQLRFWWRILNRANLSSRDLFAAETSLWGGIGADGPTASLVRLRIGEVSKADLFPAFEYKRKANREYPTVPSAAPGIAAYALFSAQGKRAENKREIETQPHSLARPGLRFTLTIECPPDRWGEVEPALRWWASFGGIGARTRRGLGAVKAQALAPVTSQEVQAAGGRLVLGRVQRNATAVTAWTTAVERLRTFRQGIEVGRNPPRDDPNRPGRSRWPEADMIRHLSGKFAPQHAPEHPTRDLYPRAAFGLPIVFHFKDRGDPTDHVLEPDGADDRMASPLILRPYWDGKGFRPAVLLLPGWERSLEQALKFKDTAHSQLTTWPSSAERREAAATQIRPIAELGDDPLSAFLDYFVKGGM